MVTVDYQQLGNKIRQARLEHNLSQEQLAEACELSPSFMGHIERGTRKMSLETFCALCTQLQLSPSYLLHTETNTDDNNIFTFDLDTLNTTDSKKKQQFMNAIYALAAGIDKL